jgi:hypothetical protein
MSDLILTILMHAVLLISCFKQLEHEKTIKKMEKRVDIKLAQVEATQKQIEILEHYLFTRLS